jgi:hypothetical protein
MNAEVDVFPADHGWKHVHLRIIRKPEAATAV